MKRKIVVIMALVLTVTAISASAAFANGNEGQGETGAIKSMFDAMRSWSQRLQENGEITKEEAKEWDKHFKDMEKYHEENGINGHCGGQNNGNEGVENQNYMPGYRNGMMGSFSGNSL